MHQCIEHVDSRSTKLHLMIYSYFASKTFEFKVAMKYELDQKNYSVQGKTLKNIQQFRGSYLMVHRMFNEVLKWALGLVTTCCLHMLY